MPANASRAPKRVLYYTRRKERAAEFFDAVAQAVGATPAGRRGTSVVLDGVSFTFVVKHEVGASLDALHHDFYNLVLLDLRDPIGPGGPRRSDDFERGLRLLDLMDNEADIERRYGFHRIIALVSGGDSREVDTRIATLGARGVGRVLRDESECQLHPGCQVPADQGGDGQGRARRDGRHDVAPPHG